MAEPLATAAWRMFEAARAGWWDYRSRYPPTILLGAVAPRVLLQCVFVTLLGTAVAGRTYAGYAYVGALGYLVTFASIARVPDVLAVDKEEGTFGRLRLGVVPLPLLVAARAVPYVAESLATIVLCLLLAPVFGLTALLPGLIAAFPIFAAMSVSSVALGVVATALTVGRRVENLAGNSMSYLVLLCAGVLVAPGALPWAEAIGRFLPVRHGLAAVRAVLAGEPWRDHLAAELMVGGAWGIAAVALLAVQRHRAYLRGHDDHA